MFSKRNQELDDMLLGDTSPTELGCNPKPFVNNKIDDSDLANCRAVFSKLFKI